MSRASRAMWIGFLWRGLVWGAAAGAIAGAAYGGILLGFGDTNHVFDDENPYLLGGWVGMWFGGMAGGGLGVISALAIATITTLRPPTDRRRYVTFVRSTVAALPVLVGGILTVFGIADDSSVGGMLLFFFVPGALAGIVAWILAPLAVRRYLDAAFPASG